MIRNHKEYRHSRERLSELEAELKKLSRSAVRPGEVASAVIDFKVSTLDTTGGLAVCEITYFHTGGPARHLHHEQDEWFYVVEGEYVIEVGDERYELGPRDSVLAPRKVDHVWARFGEGMERLIAALQPAGEIEAFFDDLAKLGSSPRRGEPRRAFSSHGLELTGPHLSIE